MSEISRKNAEKKGANVKKTTSNRIVCSAMLAFFLPSLMAFAASAQTERPYYLGKTWPNQAPADCPFEMSKDIINVGFPQVYAVAGGCDTWYPSWADDGNMYSSWTDGSLAATSGVTVTSWSGYPKATTGHAKIVGDDPMNLKIINLGTHRATALPCGGRYPCGTLVKDGIWYYGTYTCDGGQWPWGILRPFVGFRVSEDYGISWTDSACTPVNNLFGEDSRDQMIKSGTPHFVDFGKNSEHSPDGKAYLVMHGGYKGIKERQDHSKVDDTFYEQSWIRGDAVYMCRVTPSPETINDVTKYEFMAGYDEKGNAVWSKNFDDLKPFLEWDRHMGCVTITYNPGLKKYLCFVTDAKEIGGTGSYSLLIFESDKLAGPYKMVSYLDDFGGQAYFVNLPSRFISPDGKTAYLIYCNNYFATHNQDPLGGSYSFGLIKMHFYDETDKKESRMLPMGDQIRKENNIALSADVTFSTIHPSLPSLQKHPTPNGEGINDGYVGGFSYNCWLSAVDDRESWVQLEWDELQTIKSVAVFAACDQHVPAGSAFEFSDGSKYVLKENVVGQHVKPFHGTEVVFDAPKTVEWVKFVPLKGQSGYVAEIGVFK